jgi:phosphoribosylanthranilate isomerase
VVKAKISRLNLKAVQLHGVEEVDYCAALKLTGAEVIKAFGIDENFDFSSLMAYEPVVDYFLFDTQTAAHGGSGKVFDWKLLKNYQLTKPYFLSGGIDSNHIENILTLNDPRLYAIDLNSRFELEPGLKDVDKLRKLL